MDEVDFDRMDDRQVRWWTWSMIPLLPGVATGCAVICQPHTRRVSECPLLPPPFMTAAVLAACALLWCITGYFHTSV
jgi:hypothetical protein